MLPPQGEKHAEPDPLAKPEPQRAEERGEGRLQLKSGQELAGTIGEISDHWVEIKELVGKEFYDALARLDDVSAIIGRMK